MLAKAVLNSLIRPPLRRFGFELQRVSVSSSAALRRERMLRDLRIGTVLDVGANVGKYGADLRAYGYDGRIISFEPLGAAYVDLQTAAAGDEDWDTHRLALCDRNGEMEINVSAQTPWSSFLPRDCDAEASQLDYVATERVPMIELDSLDLIHDSPGWLKLDVQGFEMRVLQGAMDTLDRVAAVECEMILEPLYEGQSSVRELIEFFDDHELTLASIDTGQVRESGRIVWLDGVFVR